MNKTIEIALNFVRSDFEEIFFKDNQGDYIKDPTIKNRFIYFLLSLIGFLILLIQYLITQEIGALIIALIALLTFGYYYLERFLVLKKWRKEIVVFLDKAEQYSSHKLVLSDNYLSIIQDNIESIEHWENFKSVKVYEDFIFLEGKENVLLPLRSMSSKEYDVLKTVVSEKVK